MQLATVLEILAATALLVAVHPYLTYPISLMILSRLRAAPQSPRAVLQRQKSEPPHATENSIAILLCVHNEEQIIEDRITKLLELRQELPETEILVYTDGCTDGTVRILERFAGRITLHVSAERHGKTHGMNVLAASARARFLVFTDAAVHFHASVFASMLNCFDDPAVGCVCGRIVAVPAGASPKPSSTADVSTKYWAFDAMVRRFESRLVSTIGAHGPLFAVRRTLHEPAPVELFDDFYLSMVVLHKGYRVIQANDFCGFKAVATARGDEYARKVRIACQGFNIHRVLAPYLRRQTALVRYLYFGHKTSRWLSVFFLAAAALLASSALWLAGAWLILASAWMTIGVIVLLGFAGLKPFTHAIDVLAALAGNGVGIVKSLYGVRYQTWSSPKSARASRY